MAHGPITRARVAAALRRRIVRAKQRARHPVASTRLLLPPPRISGLVEEFSATRLQGWVAVRSGARPVRITLQADDLEVAATWATDTAELSGPGEVRRFDLRLNDLWQYVGRGNRLFVRADGRQLPIVGHGMYLVPEADGPKPFSAMRSRLARGHVFNHNGSLRLSKRLNVEWQTKMMALYSRVREVLAEDPGYDVFFIYGTLLGAVREGGVIGHDVDFDAAFVSKQANGAAAAEEMREIAYLLIDRGFDVTCMRTALHIHDPADAEIKIDLFHLYFDETGLLRFPFGIAGTTQLRAADWRGTKEIAFCGGTGLIPVNGEQFAEHIYGSGWRRPTPGFDWRRDRTDRDWAGVMPFEFGREIDWANFYARHTGFEEPSPFFDKVSRRPDLPGVVVDLGCGDGRDAHAFAATGLTVVGLDWSTAALAIGRTRAEAAGVADRVRYVACDITRPPELAAELAELIRTADGPVLFYARLFFGTITAAAQAAVLKRLAEVARPGDQLAVELRTNADEPAPKHFPRLYRYFQDGPAFGAALRTTYGFDVVEEEEGTGLAPFADEDPVLYRVIAQRP